MRVLIADDHAVVRRGLKDILADAFGKPTIGEAKTSQETLLCAQKQDWDIVILDISMPGKNGIELLGDLKEIRPRVPVLILSVYPEEQFARRALRGGAAGYLTKESVPEELVKAVRKVLGGGRYISTSLAEKLAWDLGGIGDKPLHELLSDREFQVFRMIASGKAVKEIADELALSVKTISTYRGRILEKSGMRNNAELIRYAIQNHLVD
jgi:two-component system invasion response regulator UvrY